MDWRETAMKKTEEIQSVLKYIEERMKGGKPEKPSVRLPQLKELLEAVGRVLDFQDTSVVQSKEIMQAASQISNFDVEMTYMSDYLADFAGKLADLSQSNLAIVEETTATMGQVTENVGYTSDRLQQLSKESQALTEKNSEGARLLQEVGVLKDGVVKDTDFMNKQISNLVELVHEIEGIVDSVQGIAVQTNLLALNAAIEAARAGEQGRGFAVVAGEVGVLAENTQKELDSMRKFVNEIYEASRAGKESTQQAAQSTQQMSQKIDVVFKTVGENIRMLEQVAKDVSAMDEYMKMVELASCDVNDAMEQCSRDAEDITHLTVTVSELASETKGVAQRVEEIDSHLTTSIQLLYKGMNTGITMLNNEELTEVLETAKKAHKDWENKAVSMADEMKPAPLQLDPNKCAFGHFYNAIVVRHPKLAQKWESLGDLHKEFHGIGKKLSEAISSKNAQGAADYGKRAEELSGQILSILDSLIETIREMSGQGESVF